MTMLRFVVDRFTVEIPILKEAGFNKNECTGFLSTNKDSTEKLILRINRKLKICCETCESSERVTSYLPSGSLLSLSMATRSS